MEYRLDDQGRHFLYSGTSGKNARRTERSRDDSSNRRRPVAGPPINSLCETRDPSFLAISPYKGIHFLAEYTRGYQSCGRTWTAVAFPSPEFSSGSAPGNVEGSSPAVAARQSSSKRNSYQGKPEGQAHSTVLVQEKTRRIAPGGYMLAK